MPSTARDFEELYFLVEDDNLAPRARRGQVIVADPKAEPATGAEAIAVYSDGRVMFGQVLARCGDGAVNLRTVRGDCYRLRPGEVSVAAVTRIMSHPYVGTANAMDAVTEGIRAGLRQPSP